MKVSIIVPVYNVSCYIERCLRSVFGQTYSDIECILVDDCGEDDSMVKAKNLIASYTGPVDFVCLEHSANRGLSAARNSGINVAKGDYLFFLDSDDEITPNSINLLVDLALKYPQSDFIQGNIRLDGRTVEHLSLDGMLLPEYSDNINENRRLILMDLPSIACNRLIKKSFLFSHGLFFQEGIVHEDFYWTFFMAKHVENVSFCESVTYLYYRNPGSITNNINYQFYRKRFYSRKKSVECFLKNMDEGYLLRFQKQYICTGFLACNLELFHMKSGKEFFNFWIFVLRTAFGAKFNNSMYCFIFGIHLLPPLCAVLLYFPYQWRFMEKIVAKI